MKGDLENKSPPTRLEVRRCGRLHPLPTMSFFFPWLGPGQSFVQGPCIPSPLSLDFASGPLGRVECQKKGLKQRCACVVWLVLWISALRHYRSIPGFQNKDIEWSRHESMLTHWVQLSLGEPNLDQPPKHPQTHRCDKSILIIAGNWAWGWFVMQNPSM